MMTQLQFLTRLPQLGRVRQTPVCRYAARSGELAFAAIFLLSLLTFFPLPTSAQDNPFEQAAQQNYSGRFQGDGVELRLVPEAGGWKGTVLLKGKNFTVEAAAKGTGLEGSYSEGEQTWPFTGVVDGDRFTFTAGTFTTTLTRQKLPKLEGRWRSEHVLIIFDQTLGKLGGRIQYSGGEYAFAAEEKAGDLEGVFKAGDKSFPFRVANETRGLVFNTGSFAEVITPVPNRGTLRVQTAPAVSFTLRNGGEAVSGSDGVFTFPGGQALALEVTAKGFLSACTNLTVPDYGEATWAVALEKVLIPKAEGYITTAESGDVFSMKMLCAIYADTGDWDSFSNWIRKRDKRLAEMNEDERGKYASQFITVEQLAAKQSPFHMTILGSLYFDGIGTKKDQKMGVQWFRKAAEQSFMAAQNNLGVCYATGQGVEQDLVEAVKWFHKAADQGMPRAQNSLGFCYEDGKGVDKDLAEAVKWYRKAADQNETSAQFNLGVCYANGQGVEKDTAEAVKWCRKAAAQGHEGAKKALNQLGK